eukprot:TRINITY_DN17006_c0_g1_i1.p1 TRINITY_DN17006_c0_g1~~TRINITY_DN17006_c0_g1_i1.p1  ORF type:complete len:67 (+),score=7.55 TRINITY_DN17006_c0_g1_i1:497-697(+)
MKLKNIRAVTPGKVTSTFTKTFQKVIRKDIYRVIPTVSLLSLKIDHWTSKQRTKKNAILGCLDYGN